MIKLDEKIKELLKAHKVPTSDIELIENYYNDVLKDVFKQLEHKEQPAKENKQPSIAELARESRKVK